MGHRRVTAFLLLAVMVGGCAIGAAPTYTSQDIASLPCEQDGRFFVPLEFDRDGTLLFASPIYDQRRVLEDRLRNGKVRDVFVIVHGWNKPTQVAETDYQNFICRLYRRLTDDNKMTPGEFLIVGVFWRSTFFSNQRDPALLKPFTYFRIRRRADIVAQDSFPTLAATLTNPFPPGAVHPRIFLIGHSFGARILVNGFVRNAEHESVRRLVAFKPDLLLLNAAISSEDLLPTARRSRLHPNRPKPGPVLRDSVNTPVYNIYSSKDVANGVAFRLASIFTSDEAACGAGSCAVDDFPILKVDSLGHFSETALPPTKELFWNVDATEIIDAHNDIYKGRVALLLSELLMLARDQPPQ